MQFLKNFMDYDKICSYWSFWQLVNISLCYGLIPKRWQAITSVIDDPIHWDMYTDACPGLNVSKN